MNVIQLNKIYKFYKTGKIIVKAINGISLEIKRNEFVAIMGPSGSGKTTLMNIIGCLDVPTSGEYFLNNIKVNTLNDNELARIRNKEIGFVFQSFNLMPRYNVLNNVMLPLVYAGIPHKERKEIALNILKKVGIENKAPSYPNELSGGECQRVAIARALVNNPSIILADEPTGNLDSKTSYEIMKLFIKIHNAGNTIVLVTHEEDIASFAQRIVKLKDGKIENDYINEKQNTLETI